MKLEEKITQLKSQYDVVAIINLDPWHDVHEYDKKSWMRQTLSLVHQDSYLDNQRIVFTISQGDVYTDGDSLAGQLLTQFQRRLNEIDISNFFVILLTNDLTIKESYTANYQEFSKDTVPITIEVYANEITQRRQQEKMSKKTKPGSYQYTHLDPMKIDIEDLTEQERFLLTKSSTFCMYPWIHFHAYPTGSAHPCCMADMQFPIGDMRKNTI
jgi:hypothetical protein